MIKTIVVGGSGFIGTRLISDIIEKKSEIKIIDKHVNNEFSDITIKGDIRNRDFLNDKLKNANLVVHLAAEHKDDITPISLYYDVNVEGTRNILNAMDENGIQNIIFTSSVAIYGMNKPNPDESNPADPFNDYGRSKWQAEEILRDWYFEKPQERNLTIIRPTVVFGENNRGNVYNLLKQVISGKFIMTGKGNNIKSMAYVGNVAAFLNYCSENLKGYQIYNYIDKPDLSMNEMLKHVQASLGIKLLAIRVPYWLGLLGGYSFDTLSFVSGKKFSVSSIRVKKFCASTQFDSTKAHSSGFKAPFSLVKGLDKTLRFEFIPNSIN